MTTPVEALKKHTRTVWETRHAVDILEAEFAARPTEAVHLSKATKAHVLENLERETPALEQAAEAWEREQALVALQAQWEALREEKRAAYQRLEAAIDTLREAHADLADVHHRMEPVCSDCPPWNPALLHEWIAQGRLFDLFNQGLRNQWLRLPAEGDPTLHNPLRAVDRSDEGFVGRMTLKPEERTF